MSPAALPVRQRRRALEDDPSAQDALQIQHRQTWRRAKVCRSRNETMTRRVMGLTLTGLGGIAAAWD
jgi:hypothetical protein